MSRPMSISRHLTLTEELEKLEQSITLTLQEIDHNFSRAHRIITTSILPIVEQYADHSNAVWEGSKFWKQFFEASANVSLAGYKELPEGKTDDDTIVSGSHDDDTTQSTTRAGDDSTMRTHNDEEGEKTYRQGDESLLDNVEISQSTPRASQVKIEDEEPKFAEYSSSYENLRREMKGKAAETEDPADEIETEPVTPTTPIQRRRLPKMSTTPESSPFDTTSRRAPGTMEKKHEDLLVRQVLGKKYQAVPTFHATPSTAKKQTRTPANKASWKDDMTPFSSPPTAPPPLDLALFSSPVRQHLSQPAAPRTPGISVQTPARARTAGRRPADVENEITWESSDEESHVPQKPIQFDVPQSRLLRTPARDVSRRIVADLLKTAGDCDSDDDGSPTFLLQDDFLGDAF